MDSYSWPHCPARRQDRLEAPAAYAPCAASDGPRCKLVITSCLRMVSSHKRKRSLQVSGAVAVPRERDETRHAWATFVASHARSLIRDVTEALLVMRGRGLFLCDR